MKVSIDELNPIDAANVSDQIALYDASELVQERTKRATLQQVIDLLSVSTSSTMGETFTVTNVEQGIYTNGSVVNATDTVQAVIKNMLINGGVVTFTAPSIAISSNISLGPYAAGTTISPTITINYTQADAGDLLSLTLLRNGSPIFTYSSVPHSGNLSVNYTDTGYILNNTSTYTVTTTHAAGPPKLDALGNTVPSTIIAGGATSNTLTFTVAQRLYAGWYQTAAIAPTDPGSVIDAAFIQALDTNGTPGTYYGQDYLTMGGTVDTLSPLDGYRAFIVAVPVFTVTSLVFVGSTTNQLQGNTKTVAIGMSNYNVYWVNYQSVNGSSSTDAPFRITLA